MKRFFVVIPKYDGGFSIHPMKKWLRQYPEYVPEGLDAAISTSHQLRNGLKKKAWIVRDLSDRVFLIEPHIDASLLDPILKKETGTEDNSEKQYVNNAKQSNVSCLAKYGFVEVGKWVLDQRLRFGIRFILSSLEDIRVIYAFVVADTVKYIGICDNFSTTLKNRMNRYQNMIGAGTNERIAKLIRKHLDEGQEVKIYAFKPDINLQYQSLTIDLIKGLENPLIQKEKPEWNIQG